MDEEKNKNDVFVELAKVKSEPVPIKIEDDIPIKESKTKTNDEEEGTLTVDVYDDGDYIVVQSTVAGVDDDNIEVNITTESVTIKGERKKSEKIEEKNYFYQELFWGSFSRSIILPQEVDPDDSVASLKNGILTVKMPKLNRVKAKKLKVKAD
ncbi:Hsp20/alpha crystallin family protein [Patescibacteria group bacterium]|nr:Hsp20/alpha crystallin family protein [Patescibacteria group bacterium]